MLPSRKSTCTSGPSRWPRTTGRRTGSTCFTKVRTTRPPHAHTITIQLTVQTGKWDWHSYVLKGQVQAAFAHHCPHTSRLLQEFHRQSYLMLGRWVREWVVGFCCCVIWQSLIHTHTHTRCATYHIGIPFAFSFFSTLHPKSEIAPHSGPSNLRLRCHLPLIVPSGGGGEERERRRRQGVRDAGRGQGGLALWHENRGPDPGMEGREMPGL